jgi:hypothetical protein
MTILQTYNKQDRFGFYQAGNYRSYSKLEAVYEGERSGNTATWHFNNDIFGAIDWTQEPSTDIAELYRQHAQLLRERYDYLVLWYSGGADSENILKTFVNNNIRLDEVVSYVNYDATGDKYNFLNGEIYNVAIPRIQQVKDSHQPWLHHRLIDLAQLTMNAFGQSDTKFDWIFKMNNYFNPNAFSRQNIKQQIPDWMSRIERGERVGFIHGIDKPRVTGLGDDFYFRFVDMVDTAVTPEMQRSNHEWEHDELFYWSPDAPLIPVKQAHIIKRFLKQATPDTPGITTQHVGIIFVTINGKIYQLQLAALHQLIYPGWTPVLFQVKPPSTFFTPRDTWFFKLPDTDTAKYSWQVGLEQLWRFMPNNWKTDPQNMLKGFKRLTSPPYYLGK